MKCFYFILLLSSCGRLSEQEKHFLNSQELPLNSVNINNIKSIEYKDFVLIQFDEWKVNLQGGIVFKKYDWNFIEIFCEHNKLIENNDFKLICDKVLLNNMFYNDTSRYNIQNIIFTSNKMCISYYRKNDYNNFRDTIFR